MINKILKGFFLFIFCVLLQVLIFNNIYFLRMATPFVYLLFIIKRPLGISSSSLIFLSFLLGLSVDILSNTPGMHAAACTLIGFARPYIIDVFIEKDLPEGFSPSISLFGTFGYMRYLTIMVLLQSMVLFIVESLIIFDPFYLLLRVGGSVILTVLLLFAIEGFNFERIKSEG